MYNETVTGSNQMTPRVALIWLVVGSPQRYVITGGNAGLGYFTAELLAGLGARVTIACRRLDRGERAADSIAAQVPGASVDVVHLDLADPESIARASAELTREPIDGIVANAGVLPWERAQPTVQGFEPVIGTNLLGHFALLARIHGALTDHAGVVQLGSLSAKGQRLRLDDLMSERGHPSRYTVYGRSKLAVMTFAIELDRRLRAAGRTQRSVIAHPGYATDALGPRRPGVIRDPRTRTFPALAGRFANSKLDGARITVQALLRGESGTMWGPDGRIGLGGAPILQPLRGPVLDPIVGRDLWSRCEALTGVEFRV